MPAAEPHSEAEQLSWEEESERDCQCCFSAIDVSAGSVMRLERSEMTRLSEKRQSCFQYSLPLFLVLAGPSALVGQTVRHALLGTRSTSRSSKRKRIKSSENLNKRQNVQNPSQ